MRDAAAASSAAGPDAKLATAMGVEDEASALVDPASTDLSGASRRRGRGRDRGAVSGLRPEAVPRGLHLRRLLHPHLLQQVTRRGEVAGGATAAAEVRPVVRGAMLTAATIAANSWDHRSHNRSRGWSRRSRSRSTDRQDSRGNDRRHGRDSDRGNG